LTTNERPIRRERAMHRLIVAAFAGAIASGGWLSVARAEDATHWLTPSQRVVGKGTLFSAGIAPRGASPPVADRAQLLREGSALYDEHCSTCHGADLKGSQGVPSLLQAGGAAVDFYITTGRMPLALRSAARGPGASPLGNLSAKGSQAYHVPSLFDARQTAALDAYVSEHAEQQTPIPRVRVDAGKLQHGRRIFENNCEACHGAAAQGATAGYQWVALPLRKANPTQIGEAIRIGPGVMPRFTDAQLSDDDVDAVATYVRYLAEAPQTYGGTVMDYLGPISEGAVSAIIGVGFLFWVIYFTGTKADGRRLNELDPPFGDRGS